MGRSERKKRSEKKGSLYSQPTGTLTTCPSSFNTVMFTFEERYRPLKAGAKFVYLVSSDFFFNRSRDEINENLHIKCIGVNVQFMAKMNNFSGVSELERSNIA